VASVGAVKEKPVAYFVLGAVPLELSARFFEQGVLPAEVVRAQGEYLRRLIPEASELEALGDARGGQVVAEEAASVAAAAFALAVQQKRELVHDALAPAPGFKRLVFAVACPSRSRRGARSTRQLRRRARPQLAAGFDAVVKGCDELVLLWFDGARLHVLAQGKAGELTVRDAQRYSQFRAMKDLA